MLFPGGTIAVLILVLPHAPRLDETAFVALGAIAYALAALMAIAADRLPLWAFHILVGCGAILITGAVYYSGEVTTDNEVLYLWSVLYAFYFFSARSAVPHLLLVGVAYAAVLEAEGAADPITRWLVVVSTLGVAGLIVAVLRDRVERLIARLADAARRDPLTELLNRRGLEELMDGERERAVRGDRPLSVLVGDLDGFKEVNDRFGHLCRDGRIERSGPLTVELREQDALKLERIRFTFARHGFAELRGLIDALNGFVD